MKRIILSLSMIVFVGAVIIGATGAFFSDTETSTGNTFTAGAIDLKIDNTQHYDGMVCTNTGNGYVWVAESQGSSTYPELLGQPCTGTWGLKDLVGEKFFSFLDLKPGDNGEDTISLHVSNNEAWACMAFTNLSEGEGTPAQTEPEDLVDATDTVGELASVMKFFAWKDDGDNVYENGETTITATPQATTNFINGNKIAIADSTTGNGPIIASTTSFVGVSWCMGNMTVNNYTIGCDGSGLGNETQTDTMSFDVTFDVLQSRNNLQYTCGTICNKVLTTLFQSTFETDAAGWTESDGVGGLGNDGSDGIAGDGNWSRVNAPGQGHSGSNYYALATDDTGSNDDTLTFPTSTTGYDEVALSFWYRTSTGQLNAGDSVVVEYSIDGGATWPDITTITTLPTTWTEFTASLPVETAEEANLQVRFRADLQDNGNNDNDFFKLDDVSLTGKTTCPAV